MNMDRTNRIMNEIQIMIKENHFAPSLLLELESLVSKVKNGEVNLMEYRRFNSRERFGEEIINAIVVADKRQQEKYSSLERH